MRPAPCSLSEHPVHKTGEPLHAKIALVLPPRSYGDGVVAAYLIGQRKVNTQILVHSSALLEQWKAPLEQFLEIQAPLPAQPKRRGRKKRVERIGQIGAGKNTRSGIIDVAIMQSLFEGDTREVKELVPQQYG